MRFFKCLMFSILSLSSSLVFGDGGSTQGINPADVALITKVKKIRVDFSQLVVLPDGMFIDLDEELYPLQFLGFDTQGYYATPLYWVCTNGHVQPLYSWPKCQKCSAGPDADS